MLTENIVLTVKTPLYIQKSQGKTVRHAHW